jgi:hypothetical protein
MLYAFENVFLPVSEVAAACAYIAASVTGQVAHCAQLERVSGYSKSAVRGTIERVWEVWLKASSHTPKYDKRYA